MNSTLNNQKWLICHETKPNQTKSNHLTVCKQMTDDELNC